mgnify:CR=1 FL=1
MKKSEINEIELIINNNNSTAIENEVHIDKNRNSWEFENYIINNNNSNSNNNERTVQKKFLLLGSEIDINNRLKWRVKWGQRGEAFTAFFGLLVHVIGNSTDNNIFRYMTVIFYFIGICFGVMIYYKNVSLFVVKRLLKEPNVILILLLGIFNLVVDILKPNNSVSVIFGVIYMLLVTIITFIDSITLKSRGFVIVLYALFIFLNLYNIYSNTFGITNIGIKIGTYTRCGNANMETSYKKIYLPSSFIIFI